MNGRDVKESRTNTRGYRRGDMRRGWKWTTRMVVGTMMFNGFAGEEIYVDPLQTNREITEIYY